MRSPDLSPQRPAFLDDPGAKAALSALASAGVDARFIGGCVRDALAGRPIGDIDIAAAAAPDAVGDALDQAGLRYEPTGLDHGVLTAVIDGRGYEIASLRADVETDGRRAVVAFTTDWRIDAERRDFTINAMSMDAEGVLSDPFGGREDLRKGRIRFVGDAQLRVREDALRILRFFRFYANFGQAPMDEDALAACAAQAGAIDGLSAERIAKELLRLLAAPDPAHAAALAAEVGVLHRALGVEPNIDRLSRLARLEAVTIGLDPLRRLAALHPARADAAITAARLKLSTAQARRLKRALAGDGPHLDPNLSAGARFRMFRALGGETAADRALMTWADAVGGDGPSARFAVDGWRDLIGAAARWRDSQPPISGSDALALGASPGPEIGAALAAVDGWWLDAETTPDRAACLTRLKIELNARGAV